MKPIQHLTAILTRTGNGVQGIYNNMPLYSCAGDKSPGNVNVQGIGNT